MNSLTNITDQQYLLYLGFNQDAGCISCGGKSGFSIYNTDPFKETFKRSFGPDMGIGIVEMLFRCNILALVGGGAHPKWPRNKVIIWDDHQNKCLGDLSFHSDVLAVKLRRDRIIVVLENKVHFYNFADLKLTDQIETANNPMGLVAVCPSTVSSIVACPGVESGQIRVVQHDTPSTTMIDAHDSDLAALAISPDGKRVASASTKGTIIRVFDTRTSAHLHELRRGGSKALIGSIAFSPRSDLLAITSDKGTVHLFELKPSDVELATRGRKGIKIVNMVSDGLKYASDNKSFATFRIGERRSICAFSPDGGSLVVLAGTGKYYRVEVPTPPGPGDARDNKECRLVLERDIDVSDE